MNVHRTGPSTAAVTVLLLATLAGACSSSGRPTVSSVAGEGDQVQVTVQNQRFNDATIYALWSGSRVRLGLVTGNTTQTFETDWGGPELRFEVDLVGGGDFTSDALGVDRGDHVELQIPPQ